MKNKKFLITTLASCLLLSSAIVAQAETIDGWQQTDSQWQYYVNGNKITNNWIKSPASNLWYFFDSAGNMVTDTFVNNTEKIPVDYPNYYYDSFYYMNHDGAMVTGWKRVNDYYYTSPSSNSDRGWYYFGEDGKMQRDTWIQSKVSGIWYAVGEDGEMLTNQIVPNNIKTGNGKPYYVNSEGAMINGWYELNELDDIGNEGDWIYGVNGALKESGWLKVGNNYFYFGEAEKVQKINGYNNLSNEIVKSGNSYIMQANVLLYEYDDIYYLDENGYRKSGLYTFKENGNYYDLYFDKDGKMVKGSSDLQENEFNVKKATEYKNRYIAIDKDGKVITDGYAYCETKNSSIFKIVSNEEDIPAGSYYYDLNTTKKIKSK